MQFSTLALAALAGYVSALDKEQKTTVVSVAMNSTLTFSPNNIKVEPGEFVQFQFLAGNHTVTQSTFDSPCQPIGMHTNMTGIHSGFQPVAASMAMGMVPTFTIQVNGTNPLWMYCAQGRHCQAGMVMVINENTSANSSRSLSNYKTMASSATTLVPGVAAGGGAGNGTATSGGTPTSGGSTPGGTPSSGGMSPGSSSPAQAAGVSLVAPSTFVLLGGAAALLFL